ncbi:MAG: hypothetical protein J6Q69_05420 [Clostridia bacterium]|nr:hypothetical protein [Clostridia bacterium]
MKKILSLILVLVFALTCFVACGDNDGDNNGTDNGANNGGTTPANYTLAIAVESAGGSRLTNTVGVVVFAADGKIVDAAFDCTQTNTPTIADGQIVAQSTASKVENNYQQGGMAWTWGQQAESFANYIKGKTAAEVAAIDVTNAELISGCTMTSSMADLQSVVAKAAASTRKVAFTTASSFALGVGMNTAISKKWDGSVAVTCDVSGAVVGTDGKVISAIIDTIEQSYANNDGTLTLNTLSASKLALGDAYEGDTPMDAGRWYNQMAAFYNTSIGKNATEVEGLATENITGCTINVVGAKAALVKAVSRA